MENYKAKCWPGLTRREQGSDEVSTPELVCLPELVSQALLQRSQLASHTLSCPFSHSLGVVLQSTGEFLGVS